jgi:ABC-type Fe3+/spermidine/putrescine transport system ATPase subunit
MGRVLSVRVTGLRRRLGSAEVLGGADLSVDAGTLYCLVGPSGSGKTTLLKILAGQSESDGGRVLLGGKDLKAIDPRDRATAMVFQNYALFPHLSVLDNAAFGLDALGLSAEAARARATEALAAVGAEAWASRRPQELSGGQQQRVALARALAAKPKLLLLDEPLSNLDAAARIELRDRLRALVRAQGLTVLCVLHDQKDALAMADQLGVMRAGKVVQSGAPIDVYRRPVDSWTATFLGSANLFRGQVLQIGAGEFVATTPLGEVRGALSRPERPPAIGAEVVVCIRPECLHLDAMPPDENAFAGKVTDSLFQGDLAVHRFTTPSGQVLQVSELNPRQRVGSKAVLHAWAEPEDVVGLSE